MAVSQGAFQVGRIWPQARMLIPVLDVETTEIRKKKKAKLQLPRSSQSGGNVYVNET